MKMTEEQIRKQLEQGGAVVERYIGSSTSTWSTAGVLHRYPDGIETYDKPFKDPFMWPRYLAKHLYCRQVWSDLTLV